MEQILFIVTNSAFSPYNMSLGIMLGIAVIEIVTAVLAGSGIFSFLDSLLPDLDVDLPIHLSALSFLHIGKVPSSILLVCFLTIFGVTGIIFQLLLHYFGVTLTNWVVFPTTLFFSLFPMNRIGSLLVRVTPKDETYAVSTDSFIGKTATVTLGEARVNHPTTAKLVDDLGGAHKIMVIPYEDEDVFKEGQEVLLIEKNGNYFKVSEFKS